MKKLMLISTLSFSSLLLSADAIQFNDPLFNRQWAMKNTGQVILKNISDIERIRIQGIPGNDINWVDTSKIESAKKEFNRCRSR